MDYQKLRLSSASYLSFYKITMRLEKKKIAMKTRNDMEGRRVDQLINCNNNIHEIPKSSNILQSSNSINVTLVARVMAREHYFVYYVDDETTFTLFD